MAGTPRQRHAPACSAFPTTRTTSGFIVTVCTLIDTAIGYELALAGVVAEVLDERDRAVGLEVAPEPVPEVEFVDDPGVFANGEARDGLAVGTVTPVDEVVERLEHGAVTSQPLPDRS